VRKPSEIPGAWLLLGGAVLAYYAVMNVLYFKQNGWLATHGSDIWYFLAVAQKLQPLSMLDVTSWIVRPFAGLNPEQGFIGLICVAVALHLISALLVYHYLGRLVKLEPATRLLATLLFATLPQNIVLSTASFVHFTVAQPFLILAFGQLLPWCLKKDRKPDVWGILCLAEAMIIGPEGTFLAFSLAVLALAKRWDPTPMLRTIRCPPAVAVVALCVAFALVFPLIYHLWNLFSIRFRGIDLVWQKDIRSGDLLPLGWNVLTIFGFFHLAWIATAGYALWKRHYLTAFFILFFVVMAIQMVRGFYSLELAGFVALAFLISQSEFPKVWRLRLLGGLIAWMLLLGLVPQKTSYMPPHLVRTARAIRASAKPGDIIACSPTYGFFFQAWTGLNTTDDLHKPPGTWARLAAERPMEADRVMKKQHIQYLVLTNYDFRPAQGGDWLSGGLNKTLQPLSDEDYRMSVVVRAFSMTPPMVKPLRLINDETDRVTKQRALCLTPSA
jgi:hypothetical protein